MKTRTNFELPSYLSEGIEILRSLASSKKRITALRSRSESLDWNDEVLSTIDDEIVSIAEILSDHDETVLNAILDMTGYDGIRGNEVDFNI